MTADRVGASGVGPERSAARPFVSGVILAAGTSSRMQAETPKQLLRVNDRSLLQVVVESALETQLDELIVVLGYRAEDIRGALAPIDDARLHIAVAAEHRAGQSRSLWAGLGATDPQSEAAAVLLGDQPGLDATTIDGVLAAWRSQRPRLLRPEYEGPEGEKRPGHPVVICRTIWPIMGSLRGDLGAREVIRQHPDWLETLPLPGTAPVDVDTAEDWNAWVASR
ncbi:MAG: nucleotidyltransferase family protein [Myxococcota bacterium]